MKRLNVVDNDACAACLSCTVACSEAYHKQNNLKLSTVQIVEEDGNVKVLTCDQCGKCAEVCEPGAIRQNKQGVYLISRRDCTKCMKCIDACEWGLIVAASEDSVPSKCIACDICAKACPMDILKVEETVTV
ncbi:MAG: 4Fe-4S binding protein [Eubacteriaceae bacterium]|nr:4Fe-4S binding protein [Eubacteriaceae bacterium]